MVAIRLWFGAEDLARTRVAPPDPLAETVFSVIPLRGGGHDRWRERTRRALPGAVRPLVGLNPGPGPILDLLSVAGRSTDLQEGLDRLLGARRGVLDAEIEYFAAENDGIPGGLRRLLHPDRGVHRTLAGTLHAYHRVAVEPYWPRVRAHLEARRDRAGRLMAEGGIERLFADLEPAGLRWRAPVLEIRTERVREYRLDGRGVLLAPSVFCPYPVFCHDMSDTHPHVLVYPAAPEPAVTAQLWRDPVDRTLAGLLGETRAKILAAAAGGASSTELARRTGVAVSSASEHARVLREAGLVRTDRDGGAVRHSLTELGVRLLDRHG